MYRLSDFDYDLPPELIAQTPVPRGQSRLLVVDRASGCLSDRMFPDILDYLREGDVMVVNDSRVTARRIRTTDGRGRPVELLLSRPCGADGWEAYVFPGRRFRPGSVVSVDVPGLGPVDVHVAEVLEDGARQLRFPDAATRDALKALGSVPLPPYIHQELEDEERYQTVFAREGGSAAAPTAGLHFTEEFLNRVAAHGVHVVPITLHVSVDTFRPVRTDDPDRHVMHGEWYTVSEDAACRINNRRGKLLAVGTTVVRALESAATTKGEVRATSEVTRLYIKPGYTFRVVEALLTNFHLPRSTLLMLVCAFGGYENILSAYHHAVRQRYRFYSFGDAMLII